MLRKALLLPLSWLPWRLLGLVGALSLVPLAWFADFGEDGTELDPRLTRLAAPLVARAAAALPAPQHPTRLLLLPMAGDATGYLRELLRAAVAASGKYLTLNPGTLGRYLADLGVELPTAESLQGAQLLARALPGERALWGRVEQWRPVATDGSAPAAMAFTLYLLDAEGVQWQRRFDLSDSPAGAAPSPTPGWGNLLLRTTLWLVLVAALPFLLWPVTRDLIRRRENSANALMLGLYTLIGMGSAALLAWGLLAGTPLVVTLVLATPVAGGIEFLVCFWMERLFIE